MGFGHVTGHCFSYYFDFFVLFPTIRWYRIWQTFLYETSLLLIPSHRRSGSFAILVAKYAFKYYQKSVQIFV